jgi:dTDP-4-dehydrorhamnose reductase
VATSSNGVCSSPNPLETQVIELKILVTGASGLLGYRISKLALERNHEVYSVYKENPTNSGTQIKLDITNNSEVSKVINKIKPEAIIHTAAYTDVEGCEKNRNHAWKLNAEATRHLAIASKQINSHLTYVSTDYVFDGTKGLYKEEDGTHPINYYGYAKLKGEEFVGEHAIKWCIARPSVIYGWNNYKQNFATWMINDLNRKKEVKIVRDQYVSPTLNTNLAEMLLEIAQRKIVGILHTSGGTRVSRYEYALKLAEVFNLNSDLIKPANISKMPWKAKRPRDSSLNVGKASLLLDCKPQKLDHAFELMKKEKGE